MTWFHALLRASSITHEYSSDGCIDGDLAFCILFKGTLKMHQSSKWITCCSSWASAACLQRIKISCEPTRCLHSSPTSHLDSTTKWNVTDSKTEAFIFKSLLHGGAWVWLRLRKMMWLLKHDVMGLFCGCNDKYVIKVLIKHGNWYIVKSATFSQKPYCHVCLSTPTAVTIDSDR